MRIAAHGLITDAGGSGAGAFTLLLSTLLEHGHDVTFYGVPRFTEPRSLVRFPRYRYVPMHVEAIQPFWRLALPFKSRYPAALMANVAHIAYQKRAIREIERAPAHERADFVPCLDAVNLWRSRLPIVSWPQSPPQTEWAALRKPHLRHEVVRTSGRRHLLAVESFYAYRWAQARLTMGFSDAMLCASRWSLEQWQSFGLDPARARALAYPVDIDSFREVPPPGSSPDRRIRFLWLGRAVPRKRLDLFLESVSRLRARHDDVEGLLVGRLDADPAAAPLLARYANAPGIHVEPSVPHSAVPALFARADVLVQPSESENFGFSVAEALAAGRPVVVGPTNGTLDYAGAAAFAFDRYDASALTEALGRAREAVLGDGARVARLAREAAHLHFDPRRVATAVCGNRRAGSRPEGSAYGERQIADEALHAVRLTHASQHEQRLPRERQRAAVRERERSVEALEQHARIARELQQRHGHERKQAAHRIHRRRSLAKQPALREPAIAVGAERRVRQSPGARIGGTRGIQAKKAGFHEVVGDALPVAGDESLYVAADDALPHVGTGIVAREGVHGLTPSRHRAAPGLPRERRE